MNNYLSSIEEPVAKVPILATLSSELQLEIVLVEHSDLQLWHLDCSEMLFKELHVESDLAGLSDLQNWMSHTVSPSLVSPQGVGIRTITCRLVALSVEESDLAVLGRVLASTTVSGLFDELRVLVLGRTCRALVSTAVPDLFDKPVEAVFGRAVGTPCVSSLGDFVKLAFVFF